MVTGTDIVLISLMIFIVIYLIIQSALIFTTISKLRKSATTSQIVKPTMTEEEIKRIINNTIKDIFIKRQTLVYDLNNVRFYELQDELKILCTEIEAVFSESLKKEFSFYFSEEYFYKYIVNIVELLLMNDLKTRRVKN